MEVRNISVTGIFLEGPPAEYPDLTPGVELNLAIFTNQDGAGDDDPEANVACHAQIVRVDPGEPGRRPPGFGVSIDPVDDENRERLMQLLSRAG